MRPPPFRVQAGPGRADWGRLGTPPTRVVRLVKSGIRVLGIPNLSRGQSVAARRERLVLSGFPLQRWAVPPQSAPSGRSEVDTEADRHR